VVQTPGQALQVVAPDPGRAGPRDTRGRGATAPRSATLVPDEDTTHADYGS